MRHWAYAYENIFTSEHWKTGLLVTISVGSRHPVWTANACQENVNVAIVAGVLAGLNLL